MRCLIYTRVSTTTHDQTTENQVAQLKEYAHRQNWEIVEIIEEYCSGGKSAEERNGLKKVFSMALLFWSLDRLSREGSRKTLEYLTRLDDWKVKWHSYTEEYISSLGIFSDAIISLMAALARQEKVRLSERVSAGLQRARNKGRKLGRPQIADTEKIKELRQNGHSLAEIAKRCGISRTRVHQILSA